MKSNYEIFFKQTPGFTPDAIVALERMPFPHVIYSGPTGSMASDSMQYFNANIFNFGKTMREKMGDKFENGVCSIEIPGSTIIGKDKVIFAPLGPDQRDAFLEGFHDKDAKKKKE